MKKILLILFLFVFSCSAIHADVAADFDWKFEDGTLTISGTGDMPDYEIHDNKAPWRIYQDKIEKVVIKDGVTNIGSYAFYYCENLTSVEIPNSVTSIGMFAFYGCI